MYQTRSPGKRTDQVSYPTTPFWLLSCKKGRVKAEKEKGTSGGKGVIGGYSKILKMDGGRPCYLNLMI